MGSWEGLVVYPAGYTMLRARNRVGVELIAIPLRFNNQFFVFGEQGGDVCIFSWQIVSGTMFGMPIDDPAPTSLSGVKHAST